MRLRVRRRQEDGTSVTARVTVAQTATRQELMVKLGELIASNDFPPLPPSWELSLNGKSTLSSLDASALSALGICSGDLVYIVDTQQTAPPMAFQPTSTQSATCTSANTVAKTGTQPSASASSACRNASLAAGLMETDVVSEQSSKSSFPVETQDPNLILVLTALSNYSFHLPPSVSAPELLAQGTLQAMDVYPTFAPNTTVHIKLVAMGGQLCVHARWQQGIAQGRVVSVVVPCLTLPARPLAVEQCRRKLQDHLVHPLSLELRAHLHLPSMDCLTGLPAEVKVNILSHLDHRSLVRVAQVNKEFNLLSRLPQLWQRLLQHSYGMRSSPEDALVRFVRQYQQQRHQEQRQRREAIPWLDPGPIRAGWYNPNVFIPAPRLPTPIGGDHDLFPFLPFLDPHRRREPWDGL